LFKPINHTCPKCNTRIAKYNRFGFSLKGGQTDKTKVKDIAEEVTVLEDINEDESVDADIAKDNIRQSESVTPVGVASPLMIKQEKKSKKKSKKKRLAKGNVR